jgi:hypothetical protein
MIKICERINNKNEQINQGKDKIEFHLTHPISKQKARPPHAISLRSCPRQAKNRYVIIPVPKEGIEPSFP